MVKDGGGHKSYILQKRKERDVKRTVTMPRGNGKGEIKCDLVLDEERGDKCGLYAKVTIPAGSTLGYH